MAHTTLIWDHHTARIWRTSRSGARVIQEAEAQDVTALLALLDSAEETLQIGRLRVYLDIPALDHHLERVPKMAPKLQQQLLEQNRVVGKGFGHGQHAVDYTGSGHETWGQHLVRAVAPEVDAVQ